jgi:hypothetical protein
MFMQRQFSLFFLMLCVLGPGHAFARKEAYKPAVEVNLDILDQGGVRDPDTYSRIAPESGTKGADTYIPHEIPPIEHEFLPMPEPVAPEPVHEKAYQQFYEPEPVPEEQPYTKIIAPWDQPQTAAVAEPLTPAPKKEPEKGSKKPVKQTPVQDISEDLLMQPDAQDVLESLQNP